jgi:galactose-1-phosphate uridylyltransferase
MNYSKFYNKMPDGTIKQLNPFTGTEVWTVPGRGFRPIIYNEKEKAEDIEIHVQEDYCSFCETRYFETPPEKSRLILKDGKYKKLSGLTAEDYYSSPPAEFRRVPNLFEIVTLDYWVKNFSYKMNAEQLAQKEKYTSTPQGIEHIENIIEFKLKLSGMKKEEILQLNFEQKLKYADYFFAGGHELIIAKYHYKHGAVTKNDIMSSGELSPEEHYLYIKYTIDTKEDIHRNNRYARYISIFQNWLKPAGASFDHLHKQLVALDEWGNTIEKQIEMVKNDSNIYNECGANLAAMMNLIIAENDHAIAWAGIGHRFPTIEIFSKSNKAGPTELNEDEIRGMSEVLHAIHAASGSDISCNEEWYYTPLDSIYKMPWHILIKQRLNIPAGFEGGTRIYINPVTPDELRDRIVPMLYKLRDEKKISNIRIAEECVIVPNPLKYYLS